MKKNDYIKSEIIDVNHDGMGVCKVDNFVVFVNGAITKDVCNIKIIKVKKNYAIGRLEEIIGKSPYRVKSFCPYSNECGGCDFCHIDYKYQLEIKRKNIENTLKIRGVNTDVNEVIPMENPFNYRNKGQFPCGEKDGKYFFGFYKKRSHNIIEIKNCMIQHQKINEVLHQCNKFINKYKLKSYNEETGKGLVRHLVVKYAFNTNELMVALVLNSKDFKYNSEFAQEMRSIGATTVLINYNKDKTNIILGKKYDVIYGNGYIIDELNGNKFKISLHSFYQVNPIQTTKLYNKALELMGENDNVLDAYCGIGTISLMLAEKNNNVTAIEYVKEAVDCAKENKELNALENVEFIVGLAEEEISKIHNLDAIIVDPPRKGLDTKFIDAVAQHVKKIIYISCDVKTLARDLGIFAEKGYCIGDVQPVDMFCMCNHVECVILLTRKGG
ncbi:MAG: 23S rRNA (uracil(1939)-C(5))-methyltransferase RlmD [Lachnospirales bacterium]